MVYRIACNRITVTPAVEHKLRNRAVQASGCTGSPAALGTTIPIAGTPIAVPSQVGRAWPKDLPFDWEIEEVSSASGSMAQAGDTVWVANWNDEAIVPIRPAA